jgi:hypothetical protein
VRCQVLLQGTSCDCQVVCAIKQDIKINQYLCSGLQLLSLKKEGGGDGGRGGERIALNAE